MPAGIPLLKVLLDRELQLASDIAMRTFNEKNGMGSKIPPRAALEKELRAMRECILELRTGTMTPARYASLAKKYGKGKISLKITPRPAPRPIKPWSARMRKRSR